MCNKVLGRCKWSVFLVLCQQSGVSWYGRSLLFRDVREMMISGAETRLHAPKLFTVKADGGENRPFRPGVVQRWSGWGQKHP